MFTEELNILIMILLKTCVNVIYYTWLESLIKNEWNMNKLCEKNNRNSKNWNNKSEAELAADENLRD